jgi:hypothetical protein
MTVTERLQNLTQRIAAMARAEYDYRNALNEIEKAETDTERRERWDVSRLLFARYCFEVNAVVRSVEQFAETGRTTIIADLEQFSQLAAQFNQPEQPTQSVLQN